MMNKPIVIFAGLAAAAVAAVAGVTKNQWMPPNSENAVAETVAAPNQQAAVEEKAPEQKLAAVEESTAVEQPAVETKAEPAAATTETTAAPTFDTVRVEKTGEALIAGRAEPGSDVTVKLDGKPIGTTTANVDGAFVVTPEAALPAGSGALTVESKTEEQITQSEASVAVVVPAEEKKEALVAVLKSDEPTKILQKAEPATATASTGIAAASPLSLDAVDYDESGNIVFSGSGKPGSTVRLYVDNTVAGDAKAGDDGRWSFAGSTPIPAGKHTLRVDGVDTEGKVLSRVELPFFREEPTKVAAAAETPTAETVTGETAATETPAIDEPALVATETATAEPAPETAQPETVAAAETPAVDTEIATGSTSSGQTLASAETTATTEIDPPKDGRIVIQPGNNLWRISRVIYGSGTKYTVIFESNKDQIRNPNLIFPGQVFMTPDVVPPETIDPARRDTLKPEEGGGAG